MNTNIESNVSHGIALGKTEALAKDIKNVVSDARLAVTERARHAMGATNEYVKENPWRILGFAAATGVVIGFLLSRR